MIKSDKITIYMQCIDWTCGEVAYFDVMLAKDASVRVDWGDNHCDTVMKNVEGWQRMEHFREVIERNEGEIILNE